MSGRRPAPRPPLRRCQLCGGDVYSWREIVTCGRCQDEPEVQNRLELGAMLREQREARRRTRETGG